jgi:phenylalanyl-tRNA synthetase beta chain
MKLSRSWLNDYVELSDLNDAELGQKLTAIGHAIEAVESHDGDTVFDVEITTNRIDAMSHLGMARELAAALGREVRNLPAAAPAGRASTTDVTIRIDDASEMCRRYSATVIRGVKVGPSPDKVRKRLEAVGLRPINSVVDVTNYVMLALGHPLHAFDLDRVKGKTIIVRAGSPGEKLRTLDGEMRSVDAETVVIADASGGIGLGGIMGGAESEISSATTNVLLECAWFTPSVIRRTARRLGMKTDASYRFERGVDPNDTLQTLSMAVEMILELAGGTAEAPIDIMALEMKPKTLTLRAARVAESSGNAVDLPYAKALFQRLGFGVADLADGLAITVPTYRGDIFEETDLIEEVLRFFGYDNVPASLPRVTTGDARPNPVGEAEDRIRTILAGSGLNEVVNYSFINPAHNALFTSEQGLQIVNALNENIAAMRLTMIPGMLETVAFNRSYGTRDGAMFEVGRTYHRVRDGVHERHRVAMVMYGSIGSHWGDPKRPVDFFDIKGIVEQLAQKFHVTLDYGVSDAQWLRKGQRAVAKAGDREIAHVGFLATDVLQRFGIKGDVAAAEIDTRALLDSVTEWKMTDVARYPGVPMVMGLMHGRELEYQRVIDTIHSLDVQYLHEVGLRDRFVPEGEDNAIKTTLGMWYQAFDRSLTQDEVTQIHQDLAQRVAGLLPVRLIG